jgi:hypothetical protein
MSYRSEVAGLLGEIGQSPDEVARVCEEQESKASGTPCAS